MIYGIYIFTRDLRLDDNHRLINLMKNCDKVIPMFFFIIILYIFIIYKIINDLWYIHF
jgi:deoxyribodipyrimidine photolyase